MENENWLVLSVRPPGAVAIADGRKTVELRRRFPERWRGARLLVYATSPRREVVATARVASVRRVAVKKVARKYRRRAASTREEIAAYAGELDDLAVLELAEVRPVDPVLPRADLERELGVRLRVPRSYGIVVSGSPWARVVERVRAGVGVA